MKLFLTGSTGFIGRNLIEFYKNHHVYCYMRAEDISAALEVYRPDVIINCAAEIYEPVLMWTSNVQLVQACCEHVRRYPSTKMIQIGSSSEYGPIDRASCETDPINPVDMYQATKGIATIACQGYARTYDLDICIARPYSVYGRYEKPHRLFPRLWRSFMLGEPMTLHAGEHDFIYIDDFIRGIDILLSHSSIPRGDIVNFGSGKQYSNLQVLKMFEKITGQQANVNLMGKMAKSFENKVWLCDTTYAKEAYGFSCEVDLETGIRRFIQTADYRA